MSFCFLPLLKVITPVLSLSDDNLMRAIGNFDESFAGNVGYKFFGPDTLPLNMAVIVKD